MALTLSWKYPNLLSWILAIFKSSKIWIPREITMIPNTIKHKEPIYWYKKYKTSINVVGALNKVADVLKNPNTNRMSVE